MNAKTKKEFDGIWKEHINQLLYLTHSLSRTEAKQRVLDITKELKALVQEASDEIWGRDESS